MAFRNLAIILITAIIISLLGCGGPQPGSNPTPIPAPRTSSSPSPTQNPSFTPTPTPTAEPTSTPTPSPTLTPTPTRRPTSTPTPTRRPTSTPTPTRRPTPTPTPIFPGGSGTENDPYLIYTATQLDQIRNGLDKCYKLMADIDLAVYTNWVSIGTTDVPFYGRLDGNNHIIRNLTINRREMSVQGLFSCIDSGSELTNIIMQDPNVLTWGNAGSLVGSNSGTVSNCSVTGAGTVSAISGVIGGLVGGNHGTVTNSHSDLSMNSSLNPAMNVGGLIGVNLGTVTNCYATGNVTGTETVGGLIGYNDGPVTNCYATGTVRTTSSGTEISYTGGLIGKSLDDGIITLCHASGNVSGSKRVGGLVGECYNVVSKCYATGNVSGTGDIGGLVGVISGNIDNSYAIGAISGPTAYGVGGLVGCNYGTVTNSFAVGSVSGLDPQETSGLVGCDLGGGTVSDSYYDTNTTHQSDNSGKGIPKTTAEMKTQSTFVGWDFTTIWEITTSYPFLR